MLEDTEALQVMPSLLIMARCSQLWTEIMMTIIDTTVLKTLKELGGLKSKFYVLSLDSQTKCSIYTIQMF